MKLYVRTLILMTFTYQILKAAQRSRYKIIYTAVNCTHNPEYVIQSKCFKQEITGAAEPQLNIDTIYAHDLKNYRFNLFVKVQRQLKKDFQTLLDVDVDLCKLLKDLKHQINLVHIIVESLKKKTNLVQGCPIPKNTLYYVRNLTYLEFMPAFIPETDFQFGLNFYVPPAMSVLNFSVAGRLSEMRRPRWTFMKN